jgi:hypothetical protein
MSAPRPRGRFALRTGVLAALTALLASVAFVATASAVPPRERSQPTIEGKFQINETLTAGNGVWDNNPTTFEYQWQRCNAQGSGCANITGAATRTYRLVADDVDRTVRVVVTAANQDGEAAANSAPSPVVSGADAPRNTVRPAISGTARVGEELTVSNGTWTGGARTFTYQWQRCDANGAECVEIAGATARVYGARTADQGRTLRAQVTAENAAGSTSVITDRSAAVAAAGGGGGGGETTGCSGTGPVAAASLDLPVRLLVSRWQFTPNPVTPSTRQFTARIYIADTCGRAVTGAQVSANAVPFNQTDEVSATTGADGWATLTFTMQSGFPANPGRQQILALNVKANKPGGNPLAGVSTLRSLRQNVSLRG